MNIQRIKGELVLVDEHGEMTGVKEPVTILFDPAGVRVVFGDYDDGYIDAPDVFIERNQDGTVAIHLHPDAGDPLGHVYMQGLHGRVITAGGREMCQLDETNRYDREPDVAV